METQQFQRLTDQFQKTVDYLTESLVLNKLIDYWSHFIVIGCGIALLAILLGGGLFKVLGYFRSLTHF